MLLARLLCAVFTSSVVARDGSDLSCDATQFALRDRNGRQTCASCSAYITNCISCVSSSMCSSCPSGYALSSLKTSCLRANTIGRRRLQLSSQPTTRAPSNPSTPSTAPPTIPSMQPSPKPSAVPSVTPTSRLSAEPTSTPLAHTASPTSRVAPSATALRPSSRPTRRPRSKLPSVRVSISPYKPPSARPTESYCPSRDASPCSTCAAIGLRVEQEIEGLTALSASQIQTALLCSTRYTLGISVVDVSIDSIRSWSVSSLQQVSVKTILYTINVEVPSDSSANSYYMLLATAFENHLSNGSFLLIFNRVLTDIGVIGVNAVVITSTVIKPFGTALPTAQPTYAQTVLAFSVPSDPSTPDFPAIFIICIVIASLFGLLVLFCVYYRCNSRDHEEIILASFDVNAEERLISST